MRTLTTIEEVRAAVAAARADGARIGLVPTMGALHDGHLSLVTEARRRAAFVVVSIFVNPTQFGEGEDLDSYPRDLVADEAALRSLGGDAPDVVFAPAVGEVYPRGTPGTRVLAAPSLTDVLCGARRPGHFDGVGLVVTKLHNIVRPDVVVYGRKDAQQLAVIRSIVADLDQPLEVVGAPLVREPDGLAMSSRNRYLDAGERRAALALSRALAAGVRAARAERPAAGGVRSRPSPEVVLRAARATLDSAPDVRVDYLDAVDPSSLAPPDASARGEEDRRGEGRTELLLAVAAFVGPARLIDNVLIGDEDDEDRLLAATGGHDPS